MKIIKWILITVLILILIILISLLCFYIYTKNAVKCEGDLNIETIDSLYNFNDDLQLNILKSKFDLDESTAKSTLSNKNDYRFIYIKTSVHNSSNINFVKVEPELKLRDVTVIGRPRVPFPDIPYMCIHPGENLDIRVVFLIKTEGKLDEELLSTINKGTIYITALSYFNDTHKCKRKKGSTYKNEISGGKIEATKKPAKASC